MCVPYAKLEVLRHFTPDKNTMSKMVTKPTGGLIELKSYVFGCKLGNGKVILVYHHASDVNADKVYVTLPLIEAKDEAS